MGSSWRFEGDNLEQEEGATKFLLPASCTEKLLEGPEEISPVQSSVLGPRDELFSGISASKSKPYLSLNRFASASLIPAILERNRVKADL